MQRYVIRRILLLIPVLLFVGFLSFNIIHIAPGDPAVVYLGEEASTESVEMMRERMGLNDPYLVQYLRWMANVARGDFGTSLFNDQSVVSMIVSRLEPTLILATFSLIIAVLIGIPSGYVMAIRRNSALDQGLLVTTLIGVAMPNFWLGINLIIIFSVWLGVLPTAGYVPLNEDPVQTIKYMVMPAFALGFTQAALIARMTRISMLDVLNQDYVRTARAKGLAEHRVRMFHALRNAWIPIVTVIGGLLGALLSGTIVIETVFNIPGIGRLVITAIQRRDFAVIQGTLLFIAALYVFLNLLIDILYVWLDPRIRFTD